MNQEHFNSFYYLQIEFVLYTNFEGGGFIVKIGSWSTTDIKKPCGPAWEKVGYNGNPDSKLHLFIAEKLSFFKIFLLVVLKLWNFQKVLYFCHILYLLHGSMKIDKQNYYLKFDNRFCM